MSQSIKHSPTQLPSRGLIRAAQLLQFVPFGKSTLWKWSADGRFPKPLRIGKITCWNCQEVWHWLETQCNSLSQDSVSITSEQN